MLKIFYVINLILLLMTTVKAEVVKVIPKGTILTCPKNNEKVLKTVNEISLYKEISLSDFEFLKEYPSELEKTIPCDVIKELCFHISNKWIGFSSSCELIPSNAGKYTYKEFIEYKLKDKKERDSVINQTFTCTPYKNNAEFSICVSADKKWQCLKSKRYNTVNNMGPCAPNN